MAISIASLRAGLPVYAIPSFTGRRKEIKLTQLYHPLIDHCVPNDFYLADKSLLLTGSNMSGKSTFIKAINLNLISSQVLNTSFATSYVAPFFRIATCMRIRDDVMNNKSYYMHEVDTIKRLMDVAENTAAQYVFTIDEVFKGTNTIERISAAKAILEYLNRGDHLVLVSTHDVELTQLLKDSFDLHYFQESIEQDTLSFDYQIKSGALTVRNAINILEHVGYPEQVIQEARTLADEIELQKTGEKGWS